MALDLKSYVIGKQNGYSGDITLETLNATANGTTTAQQGKAYNKVIVNVQPPLEEKSVTENGEVTPSAGKYGLSKVTVAVPLPSGTVQINENGTANVKDYEYAEVDVQPNLEVKPVVVSANGTRDITPDTGYDGLSKVELEVDVQPDLEAKQVSVTANGTQTVTPTSGKDGLSSVEITTNVQPTLQSKNVTSNGTVTPDEGYDGLSSVGVNVPSYPEPTGTKTITENGTGIDVKDYAKVDVNVPMPDEYPIGGSLADNTFTGYKFKDGITSIDLHAFDSCINLALTSLPDSITSIGQYAFRGCTNLALTSLPISLTSLESSAFQECTNLALTSLPEGITNIPPSCFLSCLKMPLTFLPDGITVINNQAFSMTGTYWPSQTAIALTKLPNSLITIGDYAFRYNYHNTFTDIPSGVTSIGTGAFGDCASLTSITFHSKPTIKSGIFTGCTNLLDIYVPWSEGEVANAPWGATNATIHYNYTPPVE